MLKCSYALLDKVITACYSMLTSTVHSHFVWAPSGQAIDESAMFSRSETFNSRISPLSTLPTPFQCTGSASADSIYHCSNCMLPLAHHSSIISRAFHGHSSRAFLFHSVSNILLLPPETRVMTTGTHVVADLQCKGCASILGWYYVEAKDQGQKYKENRFILESDKLCRIHPWEN